MAHRSEQFWRGVKAELPIAVSAIPFGLIYGVLAVETGLPASLGLAMSSIVFAGSAQFIGVQLFGSQTPALIIILTTFVVNLRHFLYATALTPHLSHLSKRWRWGLAYLLTDEAFAPSILYFQQKSDNPARHYFLLGAGVTLWGCWQLSSAAGILLGASVPGSWSLDFTLALSFIGLVVPALKDRADVAAALVAGTVALAANGLPYKLGIIAAAFAGIGAGMLLSWRKR